MYCFINETRFVKNSSVPYFSFVLDLQPLLVAFGDFLIFFCCLAFRGTERPVIAVLCSVKKLLSPQN